jgi:hypothetical protein
MNELEDLGQTMKLEWAKIVKTVVSLASEDIVPAAMSLSHISGVGRASIERKLKAVQWAISEGMAPAVIMQMGQEAVVSGYNRATKQEQVEQQVWLKWKVSGSLRDQVEVERERIMTLLKFTNSEQFVVWLHAQLASASDEEVLHSGGEAR